MSLFDRLFKGNSKKKYSNSGEEHEVRGKYMPDINTPPDERFTKNFIINGGKFLYNLNIEEVQKSFDNVLLENDWYERNVYCMDTNLISTFNGYNLKFGALRDSSFFLTTCEGLVADNGSILVSSNQLKESKLCDFPQNIIVYATTSQIVSNIGEGLRIIKDRTKGKIPSNITTIKSFEIDEKQEKDFLSYGSSSKNLYLLLLEDL